MGVMKGFQLLKKYGFFIQLFNFVVILIQLFSFEDTPVYLILLSIYLVI